MSSTPPHTPPPPHYLGSVARVGHRLRPVAIVAIIAVVLLIAAAVTAAIVLTRTTNRPKPPPTLASSHAAMAAPAQSGVPRPPNSPDGQRTPRTPRGVAVVLTSADPIIIASGISITPALGWRMGMRGPDWVVLYKADSSAQMGVEIKPAGGTDVVAVLQADINQLISTPSGALDNMKTLTGPDTKTLHSANFQQQASIDYTADISTQQGTIPVLGVFDELLNTSNPLSAFINYRQTGDATTQAASDGGMMIRSML